MLVGWGLFLFRLNEAPLMEVIKTYNRQQINCLERLNGAPLMEVIKTLHRPSFECALWFEWSTAYGGD